MAKKSSTRRKRRAFTIAQKSKAVLKHLQDGIPVSQVCEEMEIHPNQFYDWQRTALSGLENAFESDNKKQSQKRDKEVEKLQSKLIKKDEVIAELLTEHIALKKSIGRPAQGKFEASLGGARYPRWDCRVYRILESSKSSQ